MIYLDNAATTWPKPESVYQAVDTCLRTYAANPGRSGHKLALRASREIYETRFLLGEFFNIDDFMQIVFTFNATDSLNLAIKGILRPGDHGIISSMEHNSVIRPLKTLEEKGVSFSVINCDPAGRLDMEALRQSIKPNTRLIAMTHASNLTGTLLPIAEIGALAKEKNILFLLDAAQSAGIFTIDVKKHNIDLLAAPGHKGLMGPQGTGFLYIRPGLEKELLPLKEGGTGSKSSEIVQPLLMPDRYESGTLNTPGIAGLKAGLEYIKERGMENIRLYEEKLTGYLLEGLSEIPGLTIYGPNNPKEQGGVAAFNLKNKDCSETSFLLDSEYAICSRPGLHCAPLAHKTVGTGTLGAVRLSIGCFNTEDEIAETIQALKQIAKD